MSLERYVGVPWLEKGRSFDGCDCYGLLYLVYRNELGIELPAYSDRYVTATDRVALADLIRGETRSNWIEIADGEEQPFDALLMRNGRDPSHIGVVMERQRVLHIDIGGTSVIVPYRNGVIRHRVVGFYRYSGSP